MLSCAPISSIACSGSRERSSSTPCPSDKSRRGPVFTTATFIGYVLGGFSGAAVATFGIFLPVFAFVAASGPLVPRFRKSPTAGAFLDGVNVASLALMAAVTWHLGRAALVDVPTLLAIANAVLLLRFRINSAWLVLAGGIAGIALSSLRSALG